MKNKPIIAIVLIFFVLLVDQTLKIWVKTNMYLGQTIPVIGNWFYLRFTENPGMALGISIPGNFGKIFLTTLRIVVAIFIAFYLHSLIKKNSPIGLIIALSLILAGAIGNIIDSIFYGVVFSESTYFTPATIFPKGGGYAPLFKGHVVDMLYFPIIKGTYPEWFPFFGGKSFIFFRPIFNIADSAITIGVLTIIFFQKKFFSKHV